MAAHRSAGYVLLFLKKKSAYSLPVPVTPVIHNLIHLIMPAYCCCYRFYLSSLTIAHPQSKFLSVLSKKYAKDMPTKCIELKLVETLKQSKSSRHQVPWRKRHIFQYSVKQVTKHLWTSLPSRSRHCDPGLPPHPPFFFSF